MSHISRRNFMKTSALGASAAALSLSANIGCTRFGTSGNNISKEDSVAQGGPVANRSSGSDVIRVGMIGLDTSHCIAYTKHFAENPELGVQVVWVYPSFSQDIQTSRERVEGYKKEISEKYQVNVVDSAEQIAELADAIMIESNDGRRHLKDLQAVVAAGKPTYIDKPFAASLGDAKAMVKLIKKHKLPCFSTSAMRFDGAIQQVLAEQEEKFGKIMGIDVYTPAYTEPTNPGLFWYGVHGVEMIYTLMGRGCQSVSTTAFPQSEMNVGIWSDERICTMRGIRSVEGKINAHVGYGITVLREKGIPITFDRKGDSYPNFINALVKFFKTKEPPVDIEDTLEICAFMDAANKSAQKNSVHVELDLPPSASRPA